MGGRGKVLDEEDEEERGVLTQRSKEDSVQM
jgi:hypothetical protein